MLSGPTGALGAAARPAAFRPRPQAYLAAAGATAKLAANLAALRALREGRDQGGSAREDKQSGLTR